jgi:hypothetical protein
MPNLKNILFFAISVAVQFTLCYFTDFHWTGFLMLNIGLCFMGHYVLSLTNKSILFNSFASVFLLWLFYAFWINHNNEVIMYSRIATLFHIPNAYLLIFVQALFGGLLSLLSGWVFVRWNNK